MTVAALVIAAGSLGAFAFTKAEKDVKKAPVTYWVTGEAGANYVVSTTPPSPANNRCGQGAEEPCQISTTASLVSTNQITKADVHDMSQTDIQSEQPEF